jgi:hypothetical protein
MDTEITVTVAPNGVLLVKIKTEAGIERGTIPPGRLENGEFVPPDLTGEPDIVREAAEAAWTPEVVAAFEAHQRAIALPVAPAITPEGNGAALDERQRKTAIAEAAALWSGGDQDAAFNKLLELL